MPDTRQPIAEIPPAEVEKICAGEVVERPLSVVKELLENALDAGATRISVELEDGGKELIRVSDDGCGIPFAELPLALKHHHTSKLRCLDDLYGLSTLGFRGEALGSIAAVSRLTLTSRHAREEMGGRVEVSGGALVSHARLAFQRGTEVEVGELFFNTPARKKFVKSRQAEQSQIAALLTTYALAYPEVRWHLAAGGKVLLDTGGTGTREVLASLLGVDAAQQLVEIDFEFPPSAARGLISSPQHHYHNRTRQWYYVNRRPVANKLLYRAVDDAMREYVSAGKFTAGVFFLDIPPEELDVNVHPMKSEVNFAQPQAIYSLLSTAVRRALGQATQQRQHEIARGLSGAVRPAAATPPPAAHSGQGPRHPDTPLLDAQAPPGQRAIPLYRMDAPFVPPGGVMQPPQDGAPAPSGPAAERGGAAVEAAPPELVAQVAGTYLVVAGADALLIVDQHAAHERLLFDRLYAAAQQAAARAPQQQLLFPLVLPLSRAEAELLREYAAALAQLGFSADLGAGPSLIVSAAPVALGGGLTPELLHAVLEELAEHGRSALLADRTKELAAALACKAAVKAGQALPPQERSALLELLQGGLGSLACQHGRPLLLRLGRAELDRLFLR